MPVERRERVIAIWLGSTGNGRNPMINGRRQPSRGGTSRMTRECQVRFCERLGVKFPGPTRQQLPSRRMSAVSQLHLNEPTSAEIGLWVPSVAQKRSFQPIANKKLGRATRASGLRIRWLNVNVLA